MNKSNCENHEVVDEDNLSLVQRVFPLTFFWPDTILSVLKDLAQKM
jgi:hypothetical protein